MAEYVKHHYVPQFLLAQWQSGTDAKLTTYSYQRAGKDNQAFESERKTAKVVAYQRHLYSSDIVGGGKDVSVEKEFMGPYVDDPASKAHRLLLTPKGVDALDPDLGGYWAQFLLSLLIRVPRRMEQSRKQAVDVLNRMLDDDPEYNVAWVQANYPQAYSQIAAGAIPLAIQSNFLFEQLRNGRWFTRTISADCSFTLLIGDHPLVYIGTMKEDAMLVLPIAPRTAFVWYRNRDHGIRAMELKDADFAKRLNSDTVANAENFVFASDDRHKTFVHKHLGQKAI